jgi:hypothetical protein
MTPQDIRKALLGALIEIDHTVRQEGGRVNTWPGGIRHAMSQDAHEQWNAKTYPGTRQLCSHCDEPTGRCNEDTLLTDDGPLCEDCYAALAKENP